MVFDETEMIQSHYDTHACIRQNDCVKALLECVKYLDEQDQDALNSFFLSHTVSKTLIYGLSLLHFPHFRLSRAADQIVPIHRITQLLLQNPLTTMTLKVYPTSATWD